MTRPNGVTLYVGPSLLDGSPIVAIATGLRRKSSNDKTGSMVQTWILRSDVAPHEAQRTGADASICGDCPQRPSLGGACYVTTFQAPLSVYKAYQRGSYPQATAADLAALRSGNRPVRFGAYGDPAAVPMQVWEHCLPANPRRRTGYTHQWRLQGVQPMRSFLMASVDTDQEHAEASALGWRVFRAHAPSDVPVAPDGRRLIRCPADVGSTQCDKCGLCGGADIDGKPAGIDISIPAHGAKASKFSHRLPIAA